MIDRVDVGVPPGKQAAVPDELSSVVHMDTHKVLPGIVTHTVLFAESERLIKHTHLFTHVQSTLTAAVDLDPKHSMHEPPLISAGMLHCDVPCPRLERDVWSPLAKSIFSRIQVIVDRVRIDCAISRTNSSVSAPMVRSVLRLFTADEAEIRLALRTNHVIAAIVQAERSCALRTPLKVPAENKALGNNVFVFESSLRSGLLESELRALCLVDNGKVTNRPKLDKVPDTELCAAPSRWEVDVELQRIFKERFDAVPAGQVAILVAPGSRLVGGMTTVLWYFSVQVVHSQTPWGTSTTSVSGDGVAMMVAMAMSFVSCCCVQLMVEWTVAALGCCNV